MIEKDVCIVEEERGNHVLEDIDIVMSMCVRRESKRPHLYVGGLCGISDFEKER